MAGGTTIDANYGTYNPCLLIIRNKGYEVRIKCYKSPNKDSRCLYYAIDKDIQLVATSGPELLGLVVLWETFGSNWNKQSPDIMGDIITEEDDSDGNLYL